MTNFFLMKAKHLIRLGGLYFQNHISNSFLQNWGWIYLHNWNFNADFRQWIFFQNIFYYYFLDLCIPKYILKSVEVEKSKKAFVWPPLIYTAFSFIRDTQFSLINVVLCPPITAALKYKIILTMQTCWYKELVPSWILLAQWQKKISLLFSLIRDTSQNDLYFNEY